MNNIIQWNIQSMRTKFSELKLIVNKYSPACVCLQETLNSNNKPPSGYKIVHSRPILDDGHERGVAILINNQINYQPLTLNTNLQATAIKLFLGRQYTICTLYLPHIPVTKNDISQLINQLNPPFLLLGDMNARSPIWGCHDRNDKGQIFEQLLLELPISIFNNSSPTHYHIQTNTYSVIDLSICSSDCLLEFEYNIFDSLHGSDHFPIQLTLVRDPVLCIRPERFVTDKADWSLFKSLTETDIIVDDNHNIDRLVEQIENVVMNAASISVPVKSGNYRRPPVPWWSEECRDAVRDRGRAERALRRHYSLENKIWYNRAKAKCKYICNKARKESWQRFLGTINQRTNLHAIWKKVRKISGKFKANPTPVIQNNNGEMVQTHQEVAEIIATSFAGVAGDHNYSRQFLTFKRSIEAQPISFETRQQLSYNDEFSIHEMEHCLSLTTESSPGIDKITYSMIKHVHPTLLATLIALFNKIYKNNYFPIRWKVAIIIPIPKPGKDSTNPINYRPISLTSCMSKLLEKMVNIRLMWYLEKGDHISSVQSGFRSNRSTADHLTQMEHNIHQAISRKLHTIVVFFDLTKAYDRAWRRGVMQRLHSYGMRGNLPKFVKNFMSNREIIVRIGASFSSPKTIQEGILQGSVLSCSCFMIAIDEISSNLHPSIKSTLYVDDFSIYTSGSIPHLIERRLQTAINKLSDWSHRTGLTFSPAKTQSMHICRKRNCPKLAPNLTMNSANIRCVDSYKFLGLYFDNRLSWKVHITYLRAACTKTLDLFKHLSHLSWGADRVSLIRLYIMLLKPKLDYGCEAYSSASESLLQSLEPIHNAAIRIATGAFRSSPVLSLNSDSGLKPLKYYRDIKILNYMARTLVNVKHPLYHDLIENYEPSDVEVEEYVVAHSLVSFVARSEQLRLQHSLNFKMLLPEKPMSIPPWRVLPVNICKQLYSYKKNEFSPAELRNIFCEHLCEHSASMCIYTDGSKTDDGVGYAYVWGNNIVSRRVQPYTSSCTAELLAIYDSLAVDVDNQYNDITILTDSRSSIEAICRYNHSNALIKMIQHRIVMCGRRVCLCWVPSHVGVTMNEQADVAARDVITAGHVQPTSLPRTDIKCVIKMYVDERWTEQWRLTSANKLRLIKPSIKPVKSSCFKNRKWDVTLTRLRIGHTKFSHGFLMEGDHQTFCHDCIVPLSVKHVLIECPNFTAERFRHFQTYNLDLPDILYGNSVQYQGKLYAFLESINYLDSI